MRRRPAVPVLLAAGAVVAGLLATEPAAAEAERMYLECENGLVVERTNGSSWWGVTSNGSWDGTVYVHRYLSITDADGNLVHEQAYGRKSPGSSATTCVATHFGFRWTVELVQAR